MVRQRLARIPRVTRRRWLGGTLVVWGATAWPADQPSVGVSEDEQASLAEVFKRAADVGLGRFGISRTTRYVGVGDADPPFRHEALSVCEAVARDCLDHFRGLEFDVSDPKSRLVVVILRNAEAFQRFLGVPADVAVSGQYEPATNRLILYDYRTNRSPGAARANTIALVHEATHQWTFNSGLLDRAADVPVCISEGFAMYVEDRPPSGKAVPGKVNTGRLRGLKGALDRGLTWIPLERLITDDALAGGDGVGDREDGEWLQQLAYAQDWLLVDHLMKQADRRTQFHRYLRTLRNRREPTHRLPDARDAFGDLVRLDQEIRMRARRLLTQRP